ncbi:TonB-dependent siderophore receptor [Wenyingzhuangia sp. IMCC45467]
MKKLILLSLIALISTFTYAQNGVLNGNVITKENTPIPYANISIENTNYKTITDAKGNFTIENIKSGNYNLTVKYLGYFTKTTPIKVIANRATRVPTIVLEEKQEQLQEVIVNGKTANKYTAEEPSSTLRITTPLQELAQNIQVISNELLADQQTTSIMDGVIRNVSGVTMLEHWGHFARINMRGFRLPAFRNGVNVQDTWGPLAEDMNTVERIEFVKGPAGFMMSAGEPGGFYNVVTKKPTVNRVANASVSVGSFDYYRGTVDFGGKITKDDKLLYRINGMYQTSDSQRGNEDAQRYGIAPAITYNINDKTSLTAELNYQNAESYIGAAYIFAPSNDGYASLDRDFKFTDTNYPATDIDELTLFTNFKHQFNKNWSFETQLSYLRYNQEGNSTWLTGIENNGDATRYVSIWDALSVGKYFQTYLNGKFNTASITHKVMAGFDHSNKEYWADWGQLVVIDVNTPFNIHNPTYGNTTTPVFDRSIDLKDRANISNTGNTLNSLYLQDELGLLNNKIRVTLAARYSHLKTIGKEETDNVITPRIGFSTDILPSFKFYALYDQSFLPQNGFNANNEPLNDPVNAKDIEAGLKKTFFNGRLNTSFGIYKINKNKILVADPNNPNFSVYSGEIESKGFEFDMQGQITPQLNIVLNYANTDVQDQSGSLQAGFSKHITNGWFNYSFAKTTFLKGFGASLGYQYQADRSTWAWDANGNSDLPNYFRLDGALSWKNDKIKVQANINNILNEYLYSGSNYGTYLYWQSEPGINGRITISYNF